MWPSRPITGRLSPAPETTPSNSGTLLESASTPFRQVLSVFCRDLVLRICVCFVCSVCDCWVVVVHCWVVVVFIVHFLYFHSLLLPSLSLSLSLFLPLSPSLSISLPLSPSLSLSPLPPPPSPCHRMTVTLTGVVVCGSLPTLRTHSSSPVAGTSSSRYQPLHYHTVALYIWHPFIQVYY